MSLSEYLERHIVEGDEDLDQVASAILEELVTDPDTLYELLLPVLRGYITHYMRVLTLRSEQESLLSDRPTANPTADRMAFLQERFYCGPSIGHVSWAEATIAHHEARIAYQNSKVTGFMEDIARHQEAIKQIKEAGVRNLGEVYKRPRGRKTA